MKRNEALFIKSIGKIAQEDWHRRHICVPSIVTAIALEAIDWEKDEAEIDPSELFARQKDFHASSSDLQQIILEHNNYLATWRGPCQDEPNWKELIGESNYIRAVQSLQDPEYPYCKDLEYEGVLVALIEGHRLTVYDD